MRLSGDIGNLGACSSTRANVALASGQRADIGAEIPPSRLPHGIRAVRACAVPDGQDPLRDAGASELPVQYLGDRHLLRAGVYIEPLKMKFRVKN